jgi:hypothetical protein
MKKIVLTLLTVMAIPPATAQIDTVELPMTPPPDYYPSSTLWMADDPSASHLVISKPEHEFVVVDAYEFTLEKPGDSLRIVGLAGILDTLWYSYIQYPPDSTNMDARVPEYLCLYQPRPDTMILKKKVCYTDRDPKCRIKLLTTMYDQYRSFDVWQYPGLYEVYFDDTITVYDSFCIGNTHYNNLWTNAPVSPIPVQTGKYVMHSTPFGYYERDSISQRMLHTPHPGDTSWEFFPKKLFFCGLFPIIDTTSMSFHDPDTGHGGNTTRINPLADQYSYLIPNPTTDHTVIYSSFPIRSVAIFDPAGRCVMRRKVDDTSIQISLAGFAKGCYNVVIHTSAGRTVKRLLLQ